MQPPRIPHPSGDTTVGDARQFISQVSQLRGSDRVCGFRKRSAKQMREIITAAHIQGPAPEFVIRTRRPGLFLSAKFKNRAMHLTQVAQAVVVRPWLIIPARCWSFAIGS